MLINRYGITVHPADFIYFSKFNHFFFFFDISTTVYLWKAERHTFHSGNSYVYNWARLSGRLFNSAFCPTLLLLLYIPLVPYFSNPLNIQLSVNVHLNPSLSLNKDVMPNGPLGPVSQPFLAILLPVPQCLFFSYITNTYTDLKPSHRCSFHIYPCVAHHLWPTSWNYLDFLNLSSLVIYAMSGSGKI